MRFEHNKTPIPEHCDNCASVNIEYTDNKVLYGTNYGTWPKIYFCYDCRASVGCHPGSSIPLGRMADKETKSLRTEAHKYFDVLWKHKYMDRTSAYRWLALKLGIRYEDCHMSQLSKEQLRFAAEISKMHVEENREVLERRKEKRNAKSAERKQRERERSKRFNEERRFKNPRRS